MLFLSSYSFRAPLFLSSFISLAASETFLFQLTEYVSAPTCVQSCVSAGSVFGVNSYKCNVAEPESCLCSADQGQSSKVSSFAFTCASSACGNNDEASQAAGVWSSYCVANNANPASAGATGAPTAGATAATGGSGGGGSAAATPASGATSPAQTGASGSIQELLGRDRLAWGIAMGIGLPILAGGVWE